MFNSTDLLIEMLIGGLLILCAVAILIFSVFPDPLNQKILEILKDQTSQLVLGGLAIPILALAYAMGLISEFVSRSGFEWWHARVKRKRLTNYFKINHSLLSSDPLFSKYANLDLKEVVIEDVRLMGEMRFFVMMKSERLYKEIEGQINRLRVLRVLFIFLFVTLIALGWLSFSQQSGLFSGASIPLLVVTILFSLADIWAIYDRFHVYCRAVERGYKVLLIDEAKTLNKA